MNATSTNLELDELDRVAADYVRRGEHDRARELCEQILRLAPRRTQTMELLAMALAGSGLHVQGAQQLARAVVVEPGSASLQANLGVMLSEAGDFVPAVHAFEQAVRLAPHVAVIHYNLANAYSGAGNLAGAAASYRRAVAINPSLGVAYNNLGVIERRLGNVTEAIRCFEAAIRADRDFAAAHGNLGCALIASGNPWQGIESLKQAILLQPTSAFALRDIAQALVSVDEFQQAFTLYEQALRLYPDSADFHHEFGASLLKCGLAADALPQLERALALDPALAEAHLNRASALQTLGRLGEADASIRSAAALDSTLPYLLSTQFTIQRSLCDWHDMAATEERLATLAAVTPAAVHPYSLLFLSDDPGLQRHVARSYVPVAPNPRQLPVAATDGRVRVAYLSGDLRDHPVGHCIVELLERHDRSRFEVIAVSLVAAPDDPLQARIRSTCDHFIAASQLSDAAIISKLRELNVTILVDLMGYTFGDRPFILGARPAAVTVSYLGYPGTRGMSCIDYLLADRHVIPEASAQWYDEQVAWLPDCFFPSDSTLEPAATRSRSDEGLPEDATVLCGFCAPPKLTPGVFGSWMRVLHEVPATVLWLQSGNELACANLRGEAVARGIDPARLIFATRIESRAGYLGRLQLADLFLDTWPYNGHSTARDALWAGLPVLTRTGRSFASRVAASLLMTLGLTQLVAADGESYGTLAIELARNPQQLRGLREAVALARGQTPLFDTARLCRNVENAYLEMAARAQRGEPPRSFVASAVAAGSGNLQVSHRA